MYISNDKLCTSYIVLANTQLTIMDYVQVRGQLFHTTRHKLSR